MSVTLALAFNATVVDALGVTHALGSVAAPVSIAANGVALDDTIAVAAGVTKTIYTVANGGAGNFAFLMLLSDQAMQVEIATAAGASGTQSLVFTLAPNVPLVIPSDKSLSTFTSPFTGTADHINRIEVKNGGGSDGSIHILLVN
jgi:hypothetical protein